MPIFHSCLYFQFFRNFFLGYFNEHKLGTKEQAMSLESNLAQTLIHNLCKGCILTNIKMKQYLIIFLLLIAAGGIYGQRRAYDPGEIRLKLGLPYVNSFTLNPQNETRKTQTGWVGLELGLEYQYSENSFVNLESSINGAAEAFGLMDIVGEFDQFATLSINLSQNNTIGRVTIGYGLSYAWNTWVYTRTFVPDSIAPTRDLVVRDSQNLGLILNSYYRLGKTAHIGLIYRPYFLKVVPDTKFDYEHIISLDIMWRFRIKK